MENILNLLKQRRTWASIGALIAIVLTLSGIHVGFNATNFTDAVMKVIDAISGLMAVILPLLSLFKPKQ